MAAAFDAEKDNMLEGMIVISDGRSNIGVDLQDDGKESNRINPALDTFCTGWPR